jgi:tripartite-type tricarboxylate transporter receptor subunit TctC
MLRLFGIIAALIATGYQAVRAENYPERPVRVIVGFAAGSGPDIHARAIAQELSKLLNNPFIVENRTGANGTIATHIVAQASPDGYTLLFTSASLAATPYIFKNLGYDPTKDLVPIATGGELDGNFLLVDAKSPIKDLADLIARAKSGRVLYGSPGIGNGAQLTTEIFAQKAGVKLQHIPYRGASEVITALLSGSVDMMFVSPPAVLGMIKGGNVRALAFSGSKPFPGFPEVPLVKDTVPGFEAFHSWTMFLGPRTMPGAIVARLNDAVRESLRAPEVASIIQRDGFQPDDRNAEQTATFLTGEFDKAGEAVKAAKIEPN